MAQGGGQADGAWVQHRTPGQGQPTTGHVVAGRPDEAPGQSGPAEGGAAAVSGRRHLLLHLHGVGAARQGGAGEDAAAGAGRQGQPGGVARSHLEGHREPGARAGRVAGAQGVAVHGGGREGRQGAGGEQRPMDSTTSPARSPVPGARATLTTSPSRAAPLSGTGTCPPRARSAGTTKLVRPRAW